MIAEDDSHILPDDSVRAVGPQSFFADPYPAFFSMRIRIQLLLNAEPDPARKKLYQIPYSLV